ncbi:hypothetical protein [Baekduia sp. Peel2402]|uniref:hypothetical protein n=1 Tax=Baekduia sp. Peel2402 TaxID=3458296 RepID=UPI00403EA597
MTRQLATITGAGVASAVLAKTVPALPLEAGRAIRWVLFAFMALWFCVFASSLVDWYWIRPQVDGVVTEPPCRTSQQPRWEQVTRGWHGHRAVAHIAVCFAVVVGLTAIIAAAVPDIDGAALAACTAALAAVAVPIVLPAFFALWRAIDSPGIWVGDRVRVNDRRGYVLHVTMDKLFVRFRNGSNASWGRPKAVSPDAIEGEPIAFSGCDACSHVNPQCDWDAQRLNAGNPSRPFRI